jgi:hypothetical protein
MSATTETVIRELDRRTNDGFDVRLLWSPQTNRVFVAIEDQRHDDSFELAVNGADALEAFHHPFAYAGNDVARSLPREHLADSRLRPEEER